MRTAFTRRDEIPDVAVARLVFKYQRSSDRRALERVFASQERLVRGLAARYSRGTEEAYEDLLQVAYLGLQKAVRDYERRSGSSFGSYAYSKVAGELLHYLRDSGLVRRPRWARSLHSRAVAAREALARELGREPDVAEVARAVGVSVAELRHARRTFEAGRVRCVADLDSVQEVRGAGLTVEERALLGRGLESLQNLQRTAVVLYYFHGLSQSEVGLRLGLPQRRVSRILGRAVRALRASLPRERATPV